MSASEHAAASCESIGHLFDELAKHEHKVKQISAAIETIKAKINGSPTKHTR